MSGCHIWNGFRKADVGKRRDYIHKTQSLLVITYISGDVTSLSIQEKRS